MGSEVRIIIAQISKYKIYGKSEWCDLFYVKHIQNVMFLSGSRGPHGPDLPSLCGRKFKFQSVVKSFSVESYVEDFYFRNVYNVFYVIDLIIDTCRMYS